MGAPYTSSYPQVQLHQLLTHGSSHWYTCVTIAHGTCREYNPCLLEKQVGRQPYLHALVPQIVSQALTLACLSCRTSWPTYRGWFRQILFHPL